MSVQKGVDLDVIALHPSPGREAMEAAVRSAMSALEYAPLASINDVRLDALLEWCEPGERCVAITLPRSTIEGGQPWRLLYDTEFCSANLARALSAAFPEGIVAYFNLQEERDATLAVYRASEARFVFSINADALDGLLAGGEKNDAATLLGLLPGGISEAELSRHLEALAARVEGQRIKPHGPRTGGVYDAIQSIAKLAGSPKLYRFFEGWLRSDLDWDEDDVETVLAFRTE
jgi:hypothetical protein